jgi:glycosyltransferase involved in cell wall biosynthesis
LIERGGRADVGPAERPRWRTGGVYGANLVRTAATVRRYRVAGMPDAPPPLRVAIDVGPLYGHRTGIGVATAGIVGALGARGDVTLDPYLVSFRADPQPGHRRLAVPGLVASHLWSRTHRPRIDRWTRGADLVHGTNYVVPPTSLPSVVSVYDCWFLRQPDLATPVVRRAGRRLRRAVEHGAWVHASSDATAAEVRSLLGTDRVVTIHLGTPTALPPAADLARPAVADTLAGRPYVLAIGTEERRKDLARLVAAFATVASHDDGVRLVLAGAPGDASAALEQAIAALDPAVAARVLRLGRIDDDTKHWLLRRASVLAYPSLDEGFGFPIVEAQLAGTPVVASDVGAVSEIGGDGVHLVAGGDTAALAAAIARVLDDGVLRLGLVEAGNRNVNRFTWEATAVGLLDLYRTAIAAGS